MKNKILLLDIDGTIYDVPKSKKFFIKDLSKNLKIDNKILEPIVNKSFLDIKKRLNYFKPSLFAELLTKNLKSSNKKIVEKIIWDIEKFNKCLYNDSRLFLNKIYKKLDIYIFSTGDKKFQSLKLNSIKKYINKNNVYIYKDKKIKFKSLIKKFKGDKIFLIDDSPDVINKAKEINKNVTTILIKRASYNKNYNYDQLINADHKVKNLSSAVKIIKHN